MENASDALIMAGQVLVFIIALTVCISSFTTVRAEINRLVGENEEIRMAKDGETYINFMESQKKSSARVVGSDAVVASMYRAIKEDYVIYIKLKEDVFNDIAFVNNPYIKIMQATTDSRTTDSSEKPIIETGNKLIKITIGSDTNQNINQVLKSDDGGKLFEIIRNMQFNEYLGEYQNASDVQSENKEVYRIITYVQV